MRRHLTLNRTFLKAFSICLAVILFLGMTIIKAKDVWAEGEDTMVLSGEIGTIEVDSSVKTIVLSGVSQSAEDEIDVKGDVTVEIAEGSENTLGAFAFDGNATFTGAGNMSIACIVSFGQSLAFDHTGTIILDTGGICSLTGNIYFNSGVVQSVASDDVVYPVVAYSGSIFLNGGSLVAIGQVGAIYAGSQIDLEDGEVAAEASLGAAFNAGNGESGSIIVGEDFNLEKGMHVAEVESNIEGQTATTIVTEDGVASTAVLGTGPNSAGVTDSAIEALETMTDEEAKKILEEKAAETETASTVTEEKSDTKETETPAAAADDSENTSGGSGVSPVLLIITCFVAAAVAAGISGTFINNKKKKR